MKLCLHQAKLSNGSVLEELDCSLLVYCNIQNNAASYIDKD